MNDKVEPTRNTRVNMQRQQTPAKPVADANNKNAKALLDELRALMAAINTSNKPMSVPIVHYGGSGLVRFLGLLTALFGMIVIGGGIYVLVQVLLNAPTSTALIDLVEICFKPSIIIVCGVVVLALGMMTKVAADAADYQAQHLWLLKQRWERKFK